MSQPPDAPDPYLPPQGGSQPPHGQDPYSQQPYQQQPYPQPSQQPYQQQPYPQQPQGWGGGPGLDEVLRHKPATVVRLVQTMLAGAVLSLVGAAYGLLVFDEVVQSELPGLQQDAEQAGLDPDSMLGMTNTVAVVSIVVGALVAVGLWLLFAWLFNRGQGRVVGTVLGALNAAGSLFALVTAADLVDGVLQALSLAVIVLALVLLWRPATSAWFRAVAAARSSWG